MSGFGTRPTAAPIPVDANRRALAEALLGFPARVGQAFTGMANAGLQANEAFLQGRGTDGEDLYARPLLPGADTGGRLGALASFIGSNMAMGGPAGSLGAGPSMARAANALPMDEASRMARAADMFPSEGFHGTGADVRAFSPTNRGSGSREGPIGTWITDNPEAAGQFADFAARGQGGNVMPLRYAMNNPLTVNSYDEIRDLVDKFTEFSRPGYEVGGRQIRMTSDKVNYDALRKHLADQGYDGIALRNTMTDSPDGKTPINQFVVLDPANLRSRFAAFDPARRNDPDLLASFAPNPLAGALLGYQPQE